MPKMKKTPRFIFLFYLSIPLFMIHTIEEYVTLYYPHYFSIAFRSTDLPQDRFLTIEAFAISALLIAAYLLKKNLLPLPLLIFPGMLYLFQFEHIYTFRLIHMYYPGLFT